MTTDRSLLKYILLTIVTCGLYSFYFIYSMSKDINILCKDDNKKTSGLVMFILLSMVTCGFYALYWEYQIANRLQDNARKYGLYFSENGNSILLWHIVGAVLCGIGPFIAMNILIKNTNAMAMAYNASHNG